MKRLLFALLVAFFLTGCATSGSRCCFSQACKCPAGCCEKGKCDCNADGTCNCSGGGCTCKK